MLTPQGIKRVEDDIASLIVKGNTIKPWASLPCRPWSVRSHLNLAQLGPKYKRYHTYQRLDSYFLIQYFMQIAETVLEAGGSVSFEWPALCEGWNKSAFAAVLIQARLWVCPC